MALKTKYAFRGIVIAEAYVRLDNVAGGKQRGTWSGEFGIYHSEAAANPPAPKAQAQKLPDGLPPAPAPRVEPVPPLAGFTVSTPWMKDGVPEKLLYAAAKAQEMLAGATDA